MTTLTTAPRKLPVLPMVVVCYGTVTRNLDQLVRIGWLWLLVLLPLYAATQWLVWTIWATGSVGRASYVYALDMLPHVVQLPALGSIAVGWHRLLLRGERVTGPVYLRLDGVVWRYALFSLALLLIPILSRAPFLYIRAASQDWENHRSAALPLWFGVTVAWLLLLPRLSLVLPAIALGTRLSLSGSWHMTRNNSLRLVAATFLGAVPPSAVHWLSFTLSGRDTLVSFVISKLIDLVANSVAVIFAVTLLSLAYRFFADPRNESASRPA